MLRGISRCVGSLPMELLERSDLLGDLESIIDAARGGRGSIVAIGGEAGIGKTSVIEALRDRVTRARFLVGSCDSLTTPRPLGPLHDIAADPASGMARPLGDGRPRHEVFDAFLDELRSSLRPAVVVFEDVHWADEATLDLIRFVGRRVADTHGVVVLTYREDEVGPRHPLTAVLGDLATARGLRRVTLDPLSVEAVRTLADGSGVDAPWLHELTDGNPFFVTEVLGVGGGDVPQTVSDAVLARLARASEGARRLIEAASIVPDRAESWLLESLVRFTPADREGATSAGLLVPYREGLRFRHDLARRAVEASLDADRRVELHRAAVVALESPPVGEPDAARLSHHAFHAGDASRVVRWGRVATERAFAEGAHAEAYAHSKRLLAVDAEMPDRDRAEMLEWFALAARLVDESEEGLAACEEAVALRRRLGDRADLGACLAELALHRYGVGDGPGAAESAESALDHLEAIPPGPELGRALATAAHLAMLSRRTARAEALGARAIELGEALGDGFVVARGLGAVGAARVVAEIPGGEEALLAAAALGESLGMPSVRANAIGNLGSGFGEVRRYAPATRYLEETIEYSERYDLDFLADYAIAWLARVHFEQGRWGVASLHAARAQRRPTRTVLGPIVALTVQGRIDTRRGAASGVTPLREALELGSSTGDLQRVWPPSAGLAEVAFLAGTPEEIPPVVGPVLEQASDLGVRWAIGELGYWMWRAGALDSPPEGAAEPYALQIAGDWRAAAEAWRDLGCPYEEADALVDGDDEARLHALRIWDDLGAGPAPAKVRLELRSRGVSVPRGPRPATAASPAGLTARQAEVLALVAEGMSNAAIADRLFISPKTVDHHVSAILARLGVASRGEAAAEAHRRGLIDPHQT
jgi:DNA-binding CsgD family transcriptional regulator/tetratricopeptide (TPR) repeat protein